MIKNIVGAITGKGKESEVEDKSKKEESKEPTYIGKIVLTRPINLPFGKDNAKIRGSKLLNGKVIYYKSGYGKTSILPNFEYGSMDILEELLNKYKTKMNAEILLCVYENTPDNNILFNNYFDNIPKGDTLIIDTVYLSERSNKLNFIYRNQNDYDEIKKIFKDLRNTINENHNRYENKEDELYHNNELLKKILENEYKLSSTKMIDILTDEDVVKKIASGSDTIKEIGPEFTKEIEELEKRETEEIEQFMADSSRKKTLGWGPAYFQNELKDIYNKLYEEELEKPEEKSNIYNIMEYADINDTYYYKRSEREHTLGMRHIPKDWRHPAQNEIFYKPEQFDKWKNLKQDWTKFSNVDRLKDKSYALFWNDQKHKDVYTK